MYFYSIYTISTTSILNYIYCLLLLQSKHIITLNIIILVSFTTFLTLLYKSWIIIIIFLYFSNIFYNFPINSFFFQIYFLLDISLYFTNWLFLLLLLKSLSKLQSKFRIITRVYILKEKELRNKDYLVILCWLRCDITKINFLFLLS